MYVAKSAGKNQIARYDANAEQAVRDRDQLRADLRNALPRRAPGSLPARHQWRHLPTRRPGSARPVGASGPRDGPAERIHPPRRRNRRYPHHRRLGPPNRDRGQVAACAPSARGRRGPALAVNVSPVQLDDDDFVDMVTSRLQASACRPSNSRSRSPRACSSPTGRSAAGSSTRCAALGIRIAIDDFGTGYSSLSYLAGIPADIVKIDQSFVADLQPESGSRVLVKSIIDLARSLGLDVVAEGVEKPSGRHPP